MGYGHFKLSDLSPSQQAQVRAQLEPSSPRPTPASPRPLRRKNLQKPAPSAPGNVLEPFSHADKNALADEPHVPASCVKPPVRECHGEPNKTEADYNRSVLHGQGRFEAVTLRLPGGNYTPDWMTIDDGIVTFHECKGAYRFGSESRAILGFKEAAAFFPFWKFVWAQKQKGGSWIVKHVVNPDAPRFFAIQGKPTPTSTNSQE